MGSLFSRLSTATLLLAVGIIALMTISFPLGAYAFYDEVLASPHLDSTLSEIPAFLFGFPLGIPGGISLVDIFTGLWIFYLVIFTISLLGPYNSLGRVLRQALNRERLGLTRNSALSTVIAFSSLYLVSTLVESVQERAGISTGSLPEREMALAFTSVSLAPLTEELGFRVSIIGLFAFTLAIGDQGVRGALRTLWHPQRHLAKCSQDKIRIEMRKLYTVAVISGLLFGLAHVLFGTGWEIGKATTSSMAGIVLGIIYIRYGFPAAILLHWSFNYFRSAFFYFGEIAFGGTLSIVLDGLLFSTGTLSLAFLTLLFLQSRAQKITTPDSTPWQGQI